MFTLNETSACVYTLKAVFTINFNVKKKKKNYKILKGINYAVTLHIGWIF
jgi:hypothetical protein